MTKKVVVLRNGINTANFDHSTICANFFSGFCCKTVTDWWY